MGETIENKFQKPHRNNILVGDFVIDISLGGNDHFLRILPIDGIGNDSVFYRDGKELKEQPFSKVIILRTNKTYFLGEFYITEIKEKGKYDCT